MSESIHLEISEHIPVPDNTAVFRAVFDDSEFMMAVDQLLHGLDGVALA